MTAEELRYKLEQNALAVCLSVVGLATAGRIVLFWLDRKLAVSPWGEQS